MSAPLGVLNRAPVRAQVRSAGLNERDLAQSGRQVTSRAIQRAAAAGHAHWQTALTSVAALCAAIALMKYPFPVPPFSQQKAH